MKEKDQIAWLGVSLPCGRRLFDIYFKEASKEPRYKTICSSCNRPGAADCNCAHRGAWQAGCTSSHPGLYRCDVIAVPPHWGCPMLCVRLIGGRLPVVGSQAQLTAPALAAFSIVTGVIFHRAIAKHNQMMPRLKSFAMAGGSLQIGAFGAGRCSFNVRHQAHSIGKV